MVFGFRPESRSPSTGLLFESRHYRSAAICYERAIACGDMECRPFLADALLFSGDYQRAVELFDGYVNSSQDIPSEWILKSAFAKTVRDCVGTGIQARNRKLGLHLASPGENGFEESQFKAAIQADGLSGLAWFNQAYSELQICHYENAAKCYAAAALCQPNDIEAWCAAIGCAINCGRDDLLAHLISAAYRHMGENFTNALFQFVKKQPNEFPKDQIIELLGEIVLAVPTQQQSRILRIF